MGKNITSQKRGRGSPTFRTPSFRFVAKSRMAKDGTATVKDLVHCQAHSAPLALLEDSTGATTHAVCAEGVRCGDILQIGKDAPLEQGNVRSLEHLPEGSIIFNIEGAPGDGGKYVRASGGFARIITKTPAGVVVQFSSRKQRTFNPNCRATLGIAAGGGRPEKPILKAGNRVHMMKKKNRYYPKTQGSSMSAVAHPFGNKRTSRKSKARPAPKNAPPGRNVGMIHPRRTGRK